MINEIYAFILALLMAFYTIARVRKFSLLKGFVDKPDGDRKLHGTPRSNLGGVGFFIAISVSVFMLSYDGLSIDLLRFFGGLIILFFIGLKDDMEPSTPQRRLIYEIFVGLILIVGSDMRISSLYGFFGITDIPYWLSILVSLIFIIGVINAFNMIDGVDGLLGSITMLASFLYGVIFYRMGDSSWAILCFAVSGASVGFLIHNFYPAKIFMGDSGSMVIGGIFSALAITMMNQIIYDSAFIELSSAPSIAFALIALPIVDMVVVMVVRMFRGRSPMSADRRHIHHRLLEMGFTQRELVYVLLGFQLCVLVFCLFVQANFGSDRMLVSLIATVSFAFALDILLTLLHGRGLKIRSNGNH